MTALVTGATGFIGRRLVRQLAAAGIEVRALVRREDAELEGMGAECVAGDLREFGAHALDGVDTVYHAAAVTRNSSGDMFGVNVAGTRYLLELSCHRGVRRFVYLSSVSAYRPPLAPRIDETAPVGGFEPYGQSKAEAEAEVQRNAAKLETVVIRPCQVFGAGDRSGFTTRLLGLASRARVPVARGSSEFSLVHVDDLAAAVIAAGSIPAAAGGTFNIAGPRRTSLGELAAACGAELMAVPRAALRAALSARWLLLAARNRNVRPLLHTYAQPNLHGSIWLGGPEYDVGRAGDVLGYDPRIDPRDGLLRLSG